MRSESQDIETRRDLLEAANKKGLQVGGVPVAICGAALPFAVAVARDIATNTFVELGRYSWGAIALAIRGDGHLNR